MKASSSEKEINPLQSIEQWEDDVLLRYPEANTKAKEEFRNYEDPTRDTVKEFYRLNHTYQSFDFVMEKKKEFLQFNRKEMTVWSAMEYLNTLVVTIHQMFVGVLAMLCVERMITDHIQSRLGQIIFCDLIQVFIMPP